MIKKYVTHMKKYGCSFAVLVPGKAVACFPFLEGELLEMCINKESVTIRRGDW
jgi:hypothetical protein